MLSLEGLEALLSNCYKRTPRPLWNFTETESRFAMSLLNNSKHHPSMAASAAAASAAAESRSTVDRPKKMAGKYTNILIAFAATTIPMVLLPAILLSLVLAYRLTQDATLPADLQTSTDVEQSTTTAYYVNISSTTLVFIASLMSTLASTLVASLMVLYSYPMVSRIVKKSGNGGSAALPTPFQLSLFVQLCKGGLGSVWNWAKYGTGWKGRRAKVAKEVSWTGAFLVAAIGLR